MCSHRKEWRWISLKLRLSPPSPNIKELQCFLVLQKIHLPLQHHRSLTSHLKGKPKKLTRTDQAKDAFTKLKQSFTTAPILRHPDHNLPYIVEVDASNCGIGTVLSQCQWESGKLHPCEYFSRKLTLAEANYDVGNLELLSMKAALEEWWHWLEGARHTFLVLSDHKNLEYLSEARSLNPHQARWAFFCTRFCFALTYQPGESKNGKADEMSRQYEGLGPPSLPEPILPPLANGA